MKNKTIFISISVAIFIFILRFVYLLVSKKEIDDRQISESLILLLVTFLTTQLIQMSLRLVELDEKLNKHNKFLEEHPDKHDKLFKEVVQATSFLSAQDQAIRSGNNVFDIFWAVCMLLAKEGIYDLIDSQTFAVSQQDIPRFWLHAILNTDHSWLCTTYFNTEYNWEEGWVRRGVDCQKITIENSLTTVKRIFIFSNPEERNSEKWLNVMEKQKNYGIKVKWISESAPSEWGDLAKLNEELETVDIAIIDGKYLLCFKQNANDKKVEKIICTNNQAKIKRASLLYNNIWSESREFL